MRIGILTFHRAINYGAVLQMYGLYHTLRSLGAEVDVIDYRAPFNEKRFAKKRLKDLLRPREIYGILFHNSYQTYDRLSFQSFMNEMTFSKPLYNQQELELCCNSYDRIVVGSDQVWNLGCTAGDNSYLLPFPIPSSKKASYAASIAYSSIPERYEKIYQDALSTFSFLSVREKNSVKIVSELTDKPVGCHIDPSMLLSANEWMKMADYSLVPESPYLLMYLMSEDNTLIAKAKDIAQKQDLNVVYVNNRLFKLRHAINVSHITPEQWLGLFLKASYVCVNSFHGLAFAINFNKPFVVRYIPRSIANSRLQTILEEYNLISRLVEGFQEADINYDSVNEKIEVNRKKAVDYLKILVKE